MQTYYASILSYTYVVSAAKAGYVRLLKMEREDRLDISWKKRYVLKNNRARNLTRKA